MPRIDDPRIAAALAPLPADAPDPADFRYDPQFEALETEIGKLERIGPAGVHWSDVVRDSQAILAMRSKDLTVAAWLAAGLVETEGLAGLAVGLAILHDLVEQLWDTVFPQRPRARAGAFGWLTAHVVRSVPASVVDAGAGAAAVAAVEELDALDRLLADKLPDPGVALGELLRPLRSLADEQRRTDAERAAKAEAAAAPAAPPPSAPVVANPDMPVSVPTISGGDPNKVFSALREAVRTAALQILQADPAEPRAYQMLRAITWLQITELPPARGGRTELMPPPEIRREEFDALGKAGNAHDLVVALETFCSGSGLFWLDGQRLSATTLAAMGAEYAGCAQAVVQGVQALLKRLPGLPELAFSDGTGLADPTTRAWIENIVMAGPAKGGSASGAVEPWSAALTQAREKAGSGQAEEALAMLVAGGSAAPGGRARFLWRMAEASLCLESGAGDVALPILLHLDRLIDTHGLEEWEPDIAADAALMLHRSAMAPEVAKSVADGERSTIADAAFARLARANPVLAARAAGSRRS